MSNVEAEMVMGKREPTFQRIQILDTDEPTLLLGRIFMQKLGSVEFDFKRGRIKLWKYWTDIENTVEGITPLTRAQIVKRDEELDECRKKSAGELLSPDRGDGQRAIVES
ncbi:hypothetical protein LOD99_5461 [Oopsacas minuta]|uniref:Uncharacterized protein n=1 Tax=Oopsacas minuta TaxID=111878 RepID=A0AAV7JRX4_9METZ|nr:hypothetical protein LOD99_5461 [Oopsacas minuta]